MATILLKDLRKSYGNVEILKGIDLCIDDREFCVFIGPSGCGKSTLLRTIAGLEEITSGDIQIDGVRVNDVPPARRGLAMVFQSYALYPHMTVADNLAFGLRMAKVPRAERDAKVQSVARALKLESLLGRKPKDLSGGQRQRVAIGRAIVRQPKAFLFDEPLSNLDASLRVQMRMELSRMHGDLDATMIYVTHDQIEAMTLADKIVVMQAGAIEQAGSPLELYHHPRNRFVAGFLGSPGMNFLPTSVRAVLPDGPSVGLPGGAVMQVEVRPEGLREGQPVTLGVRPEDLVLADDGAVRGEVVLADRLGGQTYLHVRVESGDLLTIQADGSHPARARDIVGVRIRGESCHLFTESHVSIPRTRRDPLDDRGRSKSSPSALAPRQLVEEAS
jgi:multiple sugar transport system ATP-binding protein